MDTRTRDNDQDPRKDPGIVRVRNYKKSDGTDVESHERRRPVIKFKLKGEISEMDARIKGKIQEFDQDGKRTNSVKVNERGPLDRVQTRKLKDGSQ